MEHPWVCTFLLTVSPDPVAHNSQSTSAFDHASANQSASYGSYGNGQADPTGLPASLADTKYKQVRERVWGKGGVRLLV